MFIAMNRFRVAKDQEEAFEKMWAERDSHLADVPGFVEFDMLKGKSDDEATLYASHTVWSTKADFEAWCNSEAFRKAHANARAPKGTYLEHPKFEGFESIASLNLKAPQDTSA